MLNSPPAPSATRVTWQPMLTRFRTVLPYLQQRRCRPSRVLLLRRLLFPCTRSPGRVAAVAGLRRPDAASTTATTISGLERLSTTARHLAPGLGHWREKGPPLVDHKHRFRRWPPALPDRCRLWSHCPGAHWRFPEHHTSPLICPCDWPSSHYCGWSVYLSGVPANKPSTLAPLIFPFFLSLPMLLFRS